MKGLMAEKQEETKDQIKEGTESSLRHSARKKLIQKSYWAESKEQFEQCQLAARSKISVWN